MLERVVERRQRQPLLGRRRRSPRQATRRPRTTSGRAARCQSRRRRSRHRRTRSRTARRIRRRRRGPGGRPRRVVRAAIVGPQPVMAVQRAAGTVRPATVAAGAPQRSITARSIGHRTGPSSSERLQVAPVAAAEHVRSARHRCAHARLLQRSVQPRRVRALGQPEAAVPVAKAAPVRARCRSAAAARGPLGAAAAAPRGSPTRSRPRARRGRRESVAERGQPLGGSGVLGGRALELGGASSRLAGRRAVPRCRARACAMRPDLAQKPHAAIDHSRRLELVGQHRRQRQRQRRARPSTSSNGT